MIRKDEFEKKYPLKFKKYESVVSKLKQPPRTGWLQWNIENPETVYEHIRAVRVMAGRYKDNLELTEEELLELLDMIEIHDWPEALVGDGVILGDEKDVDKLRAHKKARELEAMITLCNALEDGPYIMSLYQRYAEGKDKIATLTKQIEKLQAVFKAVEYENSLKKKGLTAEFVHYTKDLIHHPFLQTEMKIASSRLLSLFYIFSTVSSGLISLLLVLNIYK